MKSGGMKQPWRCSTRKTGESRTRPEATECPSRSTRLLALNDTALRSRTTGSPRWRGHRAKNDPVFTDRVEIISPGHLPDCLTPEQIRAGASNRRNKVLAEHAAKILPYRGLGTGDPTSHRPSHPPSGASACRHDRGAWTKRVADVSAAAKRSPWKFPFLKRSVFPYFKLNTKFLSVSCSRSSARSLNGES